MRGLLATECMACAVAESDPSTDQFHCGCPRCDARALSAVHQVNGAVDRWPAYRHECSSIGKHLGLTTEDVDALAKAWAARIKQHKDLT